LKKTFQLQESNKKPQRTIEAIKHELRKYTKRERNKKIENPETMFWDFDCKFGQSSDEAKAMSFSDILNALDATLEQQWENCYIEILAHAKAKPPRQPKQETPQETSQEPIKEE